jgi:tRNA (mo5U34)-methyltransferase
MTKELIQTEVAKINWFHQVDLGHGIVTPGVDDSQTKLQGLGFPDDLSGMTALDIGFFF